MDLALNLGYMVGGDDPAGQLRLTRHAESLGFSSVWAAEAYGSDCVSVLAWLAGQTERIAVGSAIMHAAGDAGRPIDTFVVRKAQKSYGMGRQVEGPSVEGRRVVVVEDTSTTGGSALTAVEALQKAGAEVVAVAIIVDRATGAKERIEQTAGVPCLYAYSKSELGLDD